ncbi:MAG: fibro-slime domain-containing protein [Sandaracinus sp.]|nr:fibro-slime domain-containing protein [Sandaracinus sp.]
MRRSFFLLLALSACDCGGTAGPSRDAGGGGGRDGGGSDFDAAGLDGARPGVDGATPEQCRDLGAIVRDFRSSHPDMEAAIGSERGLVQERLDGEGKPVYSGGPSTTVQSTESFAQWYRDVADVNERFEVALPLTQTSPGVFVFEDSDFFPIDDRGFGNEGNPHNFHFTTEIRATFRYRGGETFTFRGDDDVFVFVNGRLALDLGGVHGVEEATIDFDARAASLEISPGNVYSLHVFHAERHTSESNFRIETSIDCFLLE